LVDHLYGRPPSAQESLRETQFSIAWWVLGAFAGKRAMALTKVTEVVRSLGFRIRVTVGKLLEPPIDVRLLFPCAEMKKSPPRAFPSGRAPAVARAGDAGRPSPSFQGAQINPRRKSRGPRPNGGNEKNKRKKS
jgi:hypothetical protein